MNFLLWILQVLLALHTAVGAAWKWKWPNPADTVPSLAAIPPQLWVGLSIPELICAIVLIAPIFKGPWVPAAASFLVAEMLFFTAVQLSSGIGLAGTIIYWLVVAAICTFIAYGRLALKPIR